MTASPIDSSAKAERDPVVVLAADEGFAIPLAVTIRSALDHLASGHQLQIYVLDGGLSHTTKERLVRSWPAGRYQVSWVQVDPAVLEHVPISGHANRVNYYRILTPWLLPRTVRKAIYLDADLVVRRDLSQLWQYDLQNRRCLAVQDCAAPYLDARLALDNFARCGRHLGAATPVANYAELGLDPLAAYFNSGVLVLDLDAWRAADLPRRLLACLERNQRYVHWWDQYALNVELAGDWAPLDPRWNQGSHIYAYPTWSQSPYDRQAYEQMRDDPYIVHFTTRYKPWKVSCLHPRRKEFFQVVDRTEWAGWRPWHTNRIYSLFEYVNAQNRRIRLGRRKIVSRLAESISRRLNRAA